VKITKFQPFRRGSLVGFADIHLAVGLTICGCTVHQQHGKRWVGLPGRPRLDRDKQLVIGTDGKVTYDKFGTWDSPELSRRFSDLAAAEIAEKYPQAFADETS
jgi:hypothetical protein